MGMTLEELAHWLEEFPSSDETPEHYRERFVAAAAACRELDNSRRPMSLQMPGMRKATDRSLSECRP